MDTNNNVENIEEIREIKYLNDKKYTIKFQNKVDKFNKIIQRLKNPGKAVWTVQGVFDKIRMGSYIIQSKVVSKVLKKSFQTPKIDDIVDKKQVSVNQLYDLEKKLAENRFDVFKNGATISKLREKSKLRSKLRGWKATAYRMYKRAVGRTIVAASLGYDINEICRRLKLDPEEVKQISINLTTVKSKKDDTAFQNLLKRIEEKSKENDTPTKEKTDPKVDKDEAEITDKSKDNQDEAEITDNSKVNQDEAEITDNSKDINQMDIKPINPTEIGDAISKTQPETKASEPVSVQPIVSGDETVIKLDEAAMNEIADLTEKNKKLYEEIMSNTDRMNQLYRNDPKIMALQSKINELTKKDEDREITLQEIQKELDGYKRQYGAAVARNQEQDRALGEEKQKSEEKDRALNEEKQRNQEIITEYEKLQKDMDAIKGDYNQQFSLNIAKRQELEAANKKYRDLEQEYAAVVADKAKIQTSLQQAKEMFSNIYNALSNTNNMAPTTVTPDIPLTR